MSTDGRDGRPGSRDSVGLRCFGMARHLAGIFCFPRQRRGVNTLVEQQVADSAHPSNSRDELEPIRCDLAALQSLSTRWR